MAEVDPATVPYFSLIVVPGDGVRGRRAGAVRVAAGAGDGLPKPLVEEVAG